MRACRERGDGPETLALAPAPAGEERPYQQRWGGGQMVPPELRFRGSGALRLLEGSVPTRLQPETLWLMQTADPSAAG